MITKNKKQKKKTLSLYKLNESCKWTLRLLKIFSKQKKFVRDFFYCWQKTAFRYNIAEKSSPLAYFNLKFAILKCLKVVLGHILLLNACYINWGFFCSLKYIVLAQHLTKYWRYLNFLKSFFFNIKQITTKWNIKTINAFQIFLFNLTYIIF